MAKDKKPSIFTDRGTIGSSDELDEYGVWVKSEPQVFPEADGFSPEIPDTDDLDSAIPDLEDLPDFDTVGAVSKGSDDSSIDIPNDDYELPDFETDDKTTEEDNDSDVFNFGELADPVELNSVDLDSGSLGSEDDDGFKEISMDEFVGSQNSTEEFSDPLEAEGSFESEDSLELESDKPIEIDSVKKETIKASIESKDSSETKETQPLDLSTQLLMKIAEELSSIRSELSTLKKEFSGLKAAAPQAERKEKDFLGEEDDEKIALTGDELNNILNTADFTEEAGSDAAIGLTDNEDDSDELSLSTADLDMEIDLIDTDLENLEGETKLGNSSLSDDDEKAAEGIIEETDNQASSGAEISDDSILDFSSDETDALNEILENGVEPMTFAPPPEDANYLTEDPLAENTGSEDIPPELPEVTVDESIDLSGAVIDEPDLSSEIQDNPLEEPSLEDISISLDMSDLDSTDFSSLESDSSDLESIELESSSDDLELPLSEDEPQGGDDLSILPEGFVVDEDDDYKEESLEEIAEEIEGVSEEEAEEVIEEIEEIPEDVIEKIEEIPEEESAPVIPETVPLKAATTAGEIAGIPANLKTELKTVLSYMDQLLEALPDDKIEEFAKSDYYDTYKKLFKELGLV